MRQQDLGELEGLDVRPIQPDDAEAFLSLSLQLDRETNFMMLEPDERTATVEQQRYRIEGLSEQEAILVALWERHLVGFAACFGSHPRRKRHSAYLIIGVLQACTGRGVGTTLLREVERWARARNITRLELTVMVHNQIGLALYHKAGFVVEGLRRNSLKVDGVYVHEYSMVKLLDDEIVASG